MGNVDGLKVQVEEMKQRLCASDAQQPTETGEFKDRLASIKATLQGKQNEIERLAAENKQLQGKQDEIERLAAENKQLQGMLKEVLSAIDEHQSKTSGDILRASLVAQHPNGQDVFAAGYRGRDEFEIGQVGDCDRPGTVPVVLSGRKGRPDGHFLDDHRDLARQAFFGQLLVDGKRDSC